MMAVRSGFIEIETPKFTKKVSLSNGTNTHAHWWLFLRFASAFKNNTCLSVLSSSLKVFASKYIAPAIFLKAHFPRYLGNSLFISKGSSLVFPDALCRDVHSFPKTSQNTNFCCLGFRFKSILTLKTLCVKHVVRLKVHSSAEKRRVSSITAIPAGCGTILLRVTVNIDLWLALVRLPALPSKEQEGYEWLSRCFIRFDTFDNGSSSCWWPSLVRNQGIGIGYIQGIF